MLFLCPVFYNEEVGQLEGLMNTDEEATNIISIHFRRGESFEEAMKRAQAKTRIHLTSTYIHPLFEGYFYDYRQTDNAWVEAKAFLIFLEERDPPGEHAHETLQWKRIDHQLINGLQPGYANLLRSAIQHLYDEGIHQDDFILKILEKTA
jgi:hypothetical protein